MRVSSAWTSSTRRRSRCCRVWTPNSPSLRREELAAAQTRAALAARVEALHVGLQRQDASAALLAATDQVGGLLGSVAALISVEPGYETAVATAFGSAADAVAVAGLDAARQAFDHLKAEDLGRAGMLLGAASPRGRPTNPRNGPRRWPALPALGAVRRRRGRRRARAPSRRPPGAAVRSPWSRIWTPRTAGGGGTGVVAVTRDGDVLSTHFASGGSSAQPSLIEVQAAIDDAESRLAEANHACERLRFAQSELEDRQRAASQTVEVTLARLHESDAGMAALAEELAQLSAAARSAHGEAERLLGGGRSGRAGAGRPTCPAWRSWNTGSSWPTTGTTRSSRIRESATGSTMWHSAARAAEMDARLALRTMEERVRSLAGRTETLRGSRGAGTAGSGPRRRPLGTAAARGRHGGCGGGGREVAGGSRRGVPRGRGRSSGRRRRSPGPRPTRR